MVESVLLVLPDEDLESQIRDVLEEKLSPDGLRPISVKNEKDALQHLGSNPDLIISSLNIPADRKSPLNRKECRGLSLLRTTKAARPEVPYIILASSINDDQAAEVTGLPAFGLVILEYKDQNWQDRLGNTLDSLLQGATAPGETIVEILFGLKEIELAQYRITTMQGSAALAAQGNLTIDPRLLKELAKETPSLSKLSYPGWHKKLTKIGEQLTDELLADQKFCEHFSAAVQAAGGLESTRIRFVIERDYHPVALEALLEPNYPVAFNTILPFDVNPDSRFWMLKAPMTRKLTVQGRAVPLFGDDETRSKPINCLIIEADVEGWAPGAGNLPKLSNVRDEANFLEQRLHREKGRPGGRIGLVQRISLHTLPSGTSFRQHVEETLKGSTAWHLVHFAGHSCYDEESKEGSVFFPGAEPEGIERVAIDEFAMWLDRTQFLYLSSCRNSEDNVGFDLARHGVPALIGFRWDIEDDKVGEYTRTFYEALLEGPPSLERTFVKARHEMHERYRENRIWAAPMLILQA